jgi:putative cardiolipin synthase
LQKKWITVLMTGLLSACGVLPSLEGRSTSVALLAGDGADTRLGRGLKSVVEQHPGLSGVAPLPDALDAFASRMLLIAAAQRTIDVQYYIWRDDITGNLMLHALHEAAKRQVRVRLLLDDNGTSGLDEKLALFNAHQNIEVRLFNPFVQRRFKSLGFLTDFGRLNRRMHNKSLTVDGQVTVVGGRNIGDEYFAATEGVAFADLDVMVAGVAVDEISKDFDLYWSSQSAYPLERLVTLPDAQQPGQPWETQPDTADQTRAHTYIQAAKQSRFVADLIVGKLDFHWVPVRMVSDDPAKVLNQAPKEALLLPRLAQLLGRPAVSVDLISPYFVPMQQGVDAFGALVQQGVRVRVLTNALEATDVAAVHAGYAKYREPLLEKGIALFEMRRQGNQNTLKEMAGPFGSSGSSLHAKTFAVDGKRVFVGSFNFDPRSAQLNTELGFVIESGVMAQEVAKAFDLSVPDHAYRLERSENGGLVWLESTPEGVKRLPQEPSPSLWRRLYVKFLSLLPIEPLL